LNWEELDEEDLLHPTTTKRSKQTKTFKFKNGGHCSPSNNIKAGVKLVSPCTNAVLKKMMEHKIEEQNVRRKEEFL